MDVKDIQELLKLVNRLELAEFSYKQGDLELRVRSKFYSLSKAGVEFPASYVSMPPAMPAVSAPPVVPVAQPVAKQETDATQQSTPTTTSTGESTSGNLKEVRSPIVGTFYRASGPDKAPFVKPGDTISVGSVVCIIEAMKLFNEIESEVGGKVVKVMVEDATPVEYDQLLFLVEPNP